MEFEWLSFKISLAKMRDWLRVTVPEADGISANPLGFKVVCRNESFSPEAQALIFDYLDCLTQEGELAYVQRRRLLPSAFLAYKTDLLGKNMADYTTLDKKLLLGLQPVEAEIEEIIDWHMAHQPPP